MFLKFAIKQHLYIFYNGALLVGTVRRIFFGSWDIFSVNYNVGIL